MSDPTLAELVSRGWDDHVSDAAGVAARLTECGLPLAASSEATPADRQALARLAHHVHGEHLGRWAEGIAWQQGLAALPAVVGDGATQAAVQRHAAALALAAGLPLPVLAPQAASADASEQVRVAALAAASLVPHDAVRASQLFQQALDQHAAAALPGSDPATRALAVTGNNLACELEDKPARSDDERALMILAAQTARRCWAQAGTAMETQRAEYRLSQTWLKAGDAAQALIHARACWQLVSEHRQPALERFFAQEALALAHAALGDAAAPSAAVAAAVAAASTAFAELDADDQAWCRATLQRLHSLQAPPDAGT
jgi:hypothetical protein